MISGANYEKISGQALLNGVMMRGFGRIATVLRYTDGSIKINTSKVYHKSNESKILKLPLLRGIVNVYRSLKSSINSLNDSTLEEKLTRNELIATVGFVIMSAFIIFVAIPTIVLQLFNIGNVYLYSVFESFLRLLFFVIYIVVISCSKDIRRVFKYHGAEHMAITCFESGLTLNVENVKKCSRLHPRCGTSLVLYTLFFANFIFVCITNVDLFMRVTAQFFLMPIALSLSYEFVKFSSQTDSKLVKILTLPGLYLQLLTTRTPDDEHIEIAISALNAIKS